jgi:hypothetical protein
MNITAIKAIQEYKKSALVALLFLVQFISL